LKGSHEKGWGKDVEGERLKRKTSEGKTHQTNGKDTEIKIKSSRQTEAPRQTES